MHLILAVYRLGLDLAAQGEIRISGDIQQPELDLNLDVQLNDTLYYKNADIKSKIQRKSTKYSRQSCVKTGAI